MLNNRLLMVSYIRGHIIKNQLNFNKDILKKNLTSLSPFELDSLIEFGKEKDLKLYYFKEKEILPRIKIVLGTLKAIYPTSLLDIGSGRGVFLFPLLNEFPYLDVTSIELLEHRVELLQKVVLGGVNNLTVKKADFTNYNDENLYDCVTMLEVLEHIPNYEKAIENAIKLAKNFIIITVPNKLDNNPEHLHLLTKDILMKVFNSYGITNLKFSGVNNHLVLVAKK